MDAVDRAINRKNAKLREEEVPTSQQACQERIAVEETLTPSAVYCALRRITWTNVLSFLKTR